LGGGTLALDETAEDKEVDVINKNTKLSNIGRNVAVLAQYWPEFSIQFFNLNEHPTVIIIYIIKHFKTE
jgi:hypothetical protein